VFWRKLYFHVSKFDANLGNERRITANHAIYPNFAKNRTNNMTKKLLLFALFACATLLQRAQAQSCCSKPLTTEGMAAFIADADFVRAHIEPQPYTHVSMAGGTTVTFATPDGKTASGYLLKTAKKSKKWLFVYQEWWGLNDYIKKQAETFFTDLGDVNVLAIDLYDGKVATTREDASKYMGESKTERTDAIIAGAVKYVGKKARIASVGWCFGGGQSLRSALIEGKRSVGCIMYYGMPVKEVEQLATLRCDVLGIFATREKWISAEVVKEFEANMKKAGKTLTVKNFDAEHAFANPSNPNFDKKASDEAYALSLDFLRKRY
jgi:carboxymethylenebutenolidase